MNLPVEEKKTGFFSRIFGCLHPSNTIIPTSETQENEILEINNSQEDKMFLSKFTPISEDYKPLFFEDIKLYSSESFASLKSKYKLSEKIKVNPVSLSAIAHFNNSRNLDIHILKSIGYENPSAEIRYLYSKINDWDFDISLANSACQDSVSNFIIISVLLKNDLLQLNHIPLNFFVSFLNIIKKKYMVYPNNIQVHILSVIQTLNCLLLNSQLYKIYTPLDIFGLLFSVIISYLAHKCYLIKGLCTGKDNLLEYRIIIYIL